MLVTKQPVLKRFWYPVMPISYLTDGPKPFRLLGEDIVLWLVEPGVPAALLDRCCHRSAKLSRGWCERNRLVCCYHGWEYGANGTVLRVPQGATGEERATRMAIPSFRAEERYGYVWVALAEPLQDIPEIEAAARPGIRQIDQFYETWRCTGLRFHENSFDNAHFSFVHSGTFGNRDNPVPVLPAITPLEGGFVMDSDIEVMNAYQRSMTRIEAAKTTRHQRARWWIPFARELQLTYPNGLLHSIVTVATPIDDYSSQIVQFCFRNDSEAETSTESIIAGDRQVTTEDRLVLEATDYDVPLDQTGWEFNMPSDRPGVLMRHMLRELLERHGEKEVRLPGWESRQPALRLVPPSRTEAHAAERTTA
jgi:phenylpropionate dioxygenase-like ring-hydroxylating dioxygenase large terminal subunit